MFKWLSRRARGEKGEAPASRDRLADAVVSFDSQGRVPEELVDGDPTPGPSPEYIQEATEPSADAWERERAARREIEQEKGES